MARLQPLHRLRLSVVEIRTAFVEWADNARREAEGVVELCVNRAHYGAVGLARLDDAARVVHRFPSARAVT